jgi:hypothetical protein
MVLTVYNTKESLGFRTLSIVRNCKLLENTTFRKRNLFPSTGEGRETLTLLGPFEIVSLRLFRILDYGQSPQTQRFWEYFVASMVFFPRFLFLLPGIWRQVLNPVRAHPTKHSLQFLLRCSTDSVACKNLSATLWTGNTVKHQRTVVSIILWTES